MVSYILRFFPPGHFSDVGGIAARTFQLANLSEEEQNTFWEMMIHRDTDFAADLAEHFPDDYAGDLVEDLDPDDAAKLLDRFDSDEQVDILSRLDEEQSEELLELMSPAEAESISSKTVLPR